MALAIAASNSAMTEYLRVLQLEMDDREARITEKKLYLESQGISVPDSFDD